MLDKYTLDAVFLLPSEVFYPGANAVACCMIFDLSQNHFRSNRKPSLVIMKMINLLNEKVLDELNLLIERVIVCGQKLRIIG